ncbi:MAG: M10 family metallopeptidase C-terminal domain-containing protein [Cypionkella sp.]|nr:M10 family metallopeptidase C-terminal domain-containing protein [Cypionkella sp.]
MMRVDYSYSGTGLNIDLNIQDGSAQFMPSGDQDVLFGIEHILGTSKADVLTGNSLANKLDGASGADYISGGSGNDSLIGGGSSDTLIGGSGNDKIYGGTSADKIWGGSGYDDFIFNDGHTGKSSSRDVVNDFEKGKDDLDVTDIDANTKKSGDQDFAYGGTTAKAYGVWYAKVGSSVIVYGDVTGDKKADFEIQLFGTTSLSSSDFIL